MRLQYYSAGEGEEGGATFTTPNGTQVWEAPNGSPKLRQGLEMCRSNLHTDFLQSNNSKRQLVRDLALDKSEYLDQDLDGDLESFSAQVKGAAGSDSDSGSTMSSMSSHSIVGEGEQLLEVHEGMVEEVIIHQQHHQQQQPQLQRKQRQTQQQQNDQQQQTQKQRQKQPQQKHQPASSSAPPHPPSPQSPPTRPGGRDPNAMGKENEQPPTSPSSTPTSSLRRKSKSRSGETDEPPTTISKRAKSSKDGVGGSSLGGGGSGCGSGTNSSSNNSKSRRRSRYSNSNSSCYNKLDSDERRPVTDAQNRNAVGGEAVGANVSEEGFNYFAHVPPTARTTKTKKKAVEDVKSEENDDRIGQNQNQRLLRDQVSYLERQLDALQKKNVALLQELQQHKMECMDVNPKVSELGEYCEDLQERLQRSEVMERHLRDKLKFIEASVEEAESSELAMREQCRLLIASDLEARKQIQALQKTGQELKDIVLEKEYMEQALRDKVLLAPPV